MCIACGAPPSSPFVSTVIAAVLPVSFTTASPVPATWLVGTPASVAGKLLPFEALLEEEEPPEVSATAAATPPPTSRTRPATSQRPPIRPPPRPRRRAGREGAGGAAAAGAAAAGAGAGGGRPGGAPGPRAGAVTPAGAGKP